MSNLTLLYAEDDPQSRKNYAFVLEEYFSTVYLAEDGREALDLYHEKKPDVLLLDISMPFIDGLDVARAVREKNKDIPIIMLTAHDDKEKLLTAIPLGLSKYLLKPINHESLTQTVLKVIKEVKDHHKVSVSDMEELKNTQNELKDLNKSLEEKVQVEVDKNKQQQLMLMQQSRLAQMGEVVNMIAHQWKQPLNALSVIGQTLVLKHMKGDLDTKAMDTFNANSQKQIVGMSATIDDFRDFFKPGKEKKTFDIEESINHSVKILSPLLEYENIKLTVSMSEDCVIYGFSNELGQSIINIMNNAKDALSQRDIEGKCIDINLTKNDTQVILTIADNAGGIPEDIIMKIFDPYFSTKEKKDGTGLGLHMTKLIIEEHMNGKITVENINGGAKFSIIFDREER